MEITPQASGDFLKACDCLQFSTIFVYCRAYHYVHCTDCLSSVSLSILNECTALWGEPN